MVNPTVHPPLYQRSLEVILAGQTEGGGYLACPTYPTYRYVWARDGAFIADAMRLVGQAQSALAFHRFIARAVLAVAGVDGSVPPCLPARFKMDGSLDESDWPNFQVDGYGLWLWALRRHATSHALERDTEQAAAVAARYLAAHWADPCHDPWEEGGDRLPVATLAASVAGLRAAGDLLGAGSWQTAAREAWRLLLTKGVGEGHLRKDVGVPAGVDSACLWALQPLTLFAPDDPVYQGTLAEVEARLMAPNVHRHPDDVYYGGGAWPLLSALWGMARLEGRDVAHARRALDWIVATARPGGDLPEQVPEPLLHPESQAVWQAERGPVATPLLWSHAMYLTLSLRLAAQAG
jgi:isomaltose glucohydrolase